MARWLCLEGAIRPAQMRFEAAVFSMFSVFSGKLNWGLPDHRRQSPAHGPTRQKTRDGSTLQESLALRPGTPPPLRARGDARPFPITLTTLPPSVPYTRSL